MDVVDPKNRAIIYYAAKHIAYYVITGGSAKKRPLIASPSIIIMLYETHSTGNRCKMAEDPLVWIL